MCTWDIVVDVTVIVAIFLSVIIACFYSTLYHCFVVMNDHTLTHLLFVPDDEWTINPPPLWSSLRPLQFGKGVVVADKVANGDDFVSLSLSLSLS